jgi:hypothetical protein
MVDERETSERLRATRQRAHSAPSALFDAAFQGDLHRLQELIDAGRDVNEHPPLWKSVYQPTALAYAVWGDQPDAVQLLLENRADPNQPDGVRALRRLHHPHTRSTCPRHTSKCVRRAKPAKHSTQAD